MAETFSKTRSEGGEKSGRAVSHGDSLRASLLVAAGLVLSQTSEIGKDVAMAWKYGAGPVTDAYFAAFTPAFVLYTVALRSSIQVLVPVFTDLSEKQGPEAGLALLTRLLVVFGFFFSLLALLATVFSAGVVSLLTPGLDGATAIMASKNLRFMVWVAVPGAGVALAMAYLRSARFYFVPSLLRLAGNAGFIAALLILAVGAGSLVSSAWAMFGGLALFTVFFAVKAGFRPRFSGRLLDETARKTLILFLYPVGFALAAQAVVLAERFFASLLDPGSMSVAAYTGRIYTGGANLIGGAVMGVALPALSLLASRGRDGEIREYISRGFRFLLLVSLPALVLLAGLASPLVSLLWGGGALSSEDLALSATLLRYYGLGLVFANLMPLCSSVLTASMDYPAFLAVGLVFLAMDAAANALFLGSLGVVALPVARTLANLGAVLLSMWLVQKRTGASFLRGQCRFLVKALSATLAAAGVVLTAHYVFFVSSADLSRSGLFLGLALTGALAAAAFYGTCLGLQMEEASILAGAIKNKVGIGRTKI